MNLLQTIKRFWWVALLVAGVQPAWGFALLGPLANGGDSWQTGVIGYGLAYGEMLSPGGPVNLGDIGGPKNIGEGYRRNTPVIYYTYDANFLGYFGSNGVAAVDSAFAIMNKAFTTNPVTGEYLTNGVDSYSADLSEYPPQSLHINYEAQALALTDLKSVTLHALVEQLGLAEPERYTWTLAERDAPPGCPQTTLYLVVQRNYGVVPSDLSQLQYSSYVNDTLYTYEIEETCVPPNPIAWTVPYNVDPYADVFTAVAANNMDGLGIGGYYTGLTRDDVAGLRYLYQSNNIAWETAAFIGTTKVGNTGAGAANLLTTNLGFAQPTLTTSNLNALLVFAHTNAPALVPGAFPGVAVTSAVTNWVLVTNWSVGSYLTNPPTKPYGTQILVVYSNIIGTARQPVYQDMFANVITNGNLANYPGIVLAGTNVVLNYSSNTVATLQTVQILPVTGAPYGTIATNTTYQTVVFPDMPSGEYISIPPSQCGWIILDDPPSWSVVTITNVITAATNTASTNAIGFVGSQSIVYTFTNHTYMAEPITCTNSTFSTGLYEGMGRVQFKRADYDSLLGQTFQPVTNNYTMAMIVNSQPVVQQFQRIVTAPDILLTAANDIAGNTFDGTVIRDITFDQDNIGAGLAGPGTINPRTTISYNKVGNAYENGFEFTPLISTNGFVLEASQMPVLQWASFDGSTNDPVLYPNGTSIANMQKQVLVQVAPPPPTLPDGTNSKVYTAQTFTATGGAFSPPFAWGLASGSQALPSGLYFTNSAPGVPNDTIAGTPANNPTGPFGAPFDFTVQLTDSLGRSVNWNYTITIH